MVQTLNLNNVEVITSRAEQYNAKHDFVLGRAVSSLPEFLSWTSHILQRKGDGSKGGVLYLKGGDISEELAQLGLQGCKMHQVSNLVRGLETDKFILHIPTKDVPSARHKK